MSEAPRPGPGPDGATSGPVRGPVSAGSLPAPKGVAAGPASALPGPSRDAPAQAPAAGRRRPAFGLAAAGLAVWLAACAIYLAAGIGPQGLAALSPGTVAALVAGASGPAILIWLMMGSARKQVWLEEQVERLGRDLVHLAEAEERRRRSTSPVDIADRGALASARLREGAEALASAGEALADRLGPLRHALDDTAARLDQAAAHAADAARVFDPTLTRLNAAAAEAEEAADHWDRIAAAIDPGLGETDRVIGATVAATERLADATAALDERLQALAAAGEQAASRTLEIMGAVSESSREFDAMAGRIEPLAGGLARGHQELGAAAEAVAQRLAGAEEAVVRGRARLIEAATESEARLADYADVLTERATTVVAAADRLAELARTKDAVERVCADLAERVGEATTRLEAVRAGMEEQSAGLVAALAAAGTDGAERLDRSADELHRRLDGIATVTAQSERRIEEASGSLTRQSERLVESAGQAANIMHEAAAVFLSQTTALAKASREAHEQAAKVRESEFHARRDAFLNAAKFILESLHSLSVDVARLLESDIPAQTWKAFHRGDTGIFTRRLASLRSQIPGDRLRARYDEDGEFRSYVDRYVRQFEELFDQAMAHDHGDLLSSTFMTADVGKIYLMLCAALGRERPRRAGM